MISEVYINERYDLNRTEVCYVRSGRHFRLLEDNGSPTTLNGEWNWREEFSKVAGAIMSFNTF